MTMAEPDPRLLAGIAADLLDRGAALDRTSGLIAAATVIALALSLASVEGAVVAALLAAGLVAALGQMVLALRVGFDAALFRRLSLAPDLAAFDAAMTALALMPAAKTGRPMAARIAGARRLIVVQGACLAAQVTLVLLAFGGTLP